MSRSRKDVAVALKRKKAPRCHTRVRTQGRRLSDCRVTPVRSGWESTTCEGSGVNADSEPGSVHLASVVLAKLLNFSFHVCKTGIPDNLRSVKHLTHCLMYT